MHVPKRIYHVIKWLGCAMHASNPHMQLHHAMDGTVNGMVMELMRPLLLHAPLFCTKTAGRCSASWGGLRLVARPGLEFSPLTSFCLSPGIFLSTELHNFPSFAGLMVAVGAELRASLPGDGVDPGRHFAVAQSFVNKIMVGGCMMTYKFLGITQSHTTKGWCGSILNLV